ncbi:MAG TPA: helix-turn-helix domain-containing protein [Solirubrobacteraceae bacterium]|jgi:transcriptional regulator with XRE-family HTH domain|nr:helix-turn-helix domain-containing protein [Solirubrobacteraceae bacterium]
MVDDQDQALGFGRRLAEVRAQRGDSLRDIEQRSGLNNGYLSQLENGKIAHPSPTVLQKVATGYGLRLEDLLQWAGYISGDEDPLSPKQAVALSTVSTLGEPSDEELKALTAIVELLRSNRSATYSPPSDLPLDEQTTAAVRSYAVALLREADAVGRHPTPLGDIQQAAQLVLAGELILNTRDRVRLSERFGGWVNLAWKRLQGTLDFRSSEIWVAPDLHAMKKRFVIAHEIGHAILPAHKQTFAHIDDITRLPPLARDLYEREANQAAVEILLQGGRASDEFDSSPPSVEQICKLSAAYGASIVATARYTVENSRHSVALAMSHHRPDGSLGPTHLYTSNSFQARYGWTDGRTGQTQVRTALASATNDSRETWVVENRRGEPRLAAAQTMDTGYSAIVLVAPESRTRTVTRKLSPLHRVREALPT